MKSPVKISITALAMGFLAVGQLVAKDPMTESLNKLKGEAFDHKFVGQMIEHHQQGIEMAGLAQQRALRPEIKQFAQKMSDKQKKEVEELKGMAGSGHHALTSGTSSDRHVSTTAGISRSEETKGAHVGPTSTDKGSLTSGRDTSHTIGTSHAGTTSQAGTTSHAGAGAPTGRTSHDGSSHEAMKTEAMGKLQAAQGAEFDRAFTDEMIKHHGMAIEMSQLAKSRASSTQVKQFAQKTIDDQKKEVDELKGFKRGSSR